MPGSSHEPGLGWVSICLVSASLRHPLPPHMEHVEAHSPVCPGQVLELEARMMQAWPGGFLQTMWTLDIGIWLLRHSCLDWDSPYLPPRTLEPKEVPVQAEPRAGDTPSKVSSSSSPSAHIFLTPVQNKRTPCPAGSGPSSAGNACGNSDVFLCGVYALARTVVRQRPCLTRGATYVCACVFLDGFNVHSCIQAQDMCVYTCGLV